jgi:trk system potassium uptake protein TrkA
MYIIIVGGGNAGYYLSKTLLNEGHEILIIERDAKRVKRIEEELGSICMQGDGCKASTLDEAGAERANLFIALTGEDENNLVACQVAKHKFNVPRTIARINNPKNEAIFKKLGIDVTASSTNLVLEHIEEVVPTHPLTHLLALDRDELEVVEVKIPPTSTAVGRQIGEISPLLESILALIIRGGQKPRVPTLDTVLEAGDRVIVVTKPDQEEVLRTALSSS